VAPPAISAVKAEPTRKKGELSEEEKAESKRLQVEASKASRKKIID
jgi:hypothetical protein